MLAHNSFVFHYGQVLLYIRPSVSQFKNGGGSLNIFQKMFYNIDNWSGD